MTANEFSVDRVDSLNNVASTTSAANEKDQKRRNRQRPGSRRLNEPESPSAQSADDPAADSEQHTIDFQA